MILRQLLHQEELGSATLVEDIAQLQAHLNNLVEQHQVKFLLPGSFTASNLAPGPRPSPIITRTDFWVRAGRAQHFRALVHYQFPGEFSDGGGKVELVDSSFLGIHGQLLSRENFKPSHLCDVVAQNSSRISTLELHLSTSLFDAFSDNPPRAFPQPRTLRVYGTPVDLLEQTGHCLWSAELLTVSVCSLSDRCRYFHSELSLAVYTWLNPSFHSTAC